jgi:hypothetical protein
MLVTPELTQEALRNLDDGIKSGFQALRDEYFFKLLVCTAAAVIGVVLEEVEYFLSWHSVRRLLPLRIAVPPIRLDTIARRVAKIGWLLIVLGVAGEGIYEARVSQADALLQDFSNILSAAQELEISTLGNITAIARDDARTASEFSGKAQDLAMSARKEADSFEARIKSATDTAIAAESHLAEALKRAADATADLNRLTSELDRVRSPRTLVNIDNLVSRLVRFKGTTYKFDTVFGDGESSVKQIETVLTRAGWKRIVSTEPRFGVPALPVFGPKDLVEIGAYDGIVVSVDSDKAVEFLKSLPPDKLPPLVQVAIGLSDALFSSLSPAAEEKTIVDVEQGTSTVIRINVGKKKP